MSAAKYPGRAVALGPPYDDGTYFQGGKWRKLPANRDERLTVSDISEALWEVSRDYGVRLAVDEQAAIARGIHQHARRIPTSDSINRAFRAIGLSAPRGFAIAVRTRLNRLYGTGR